MSQAVDILNSVIDTYRQLKTYSDSGTVTALIQVGSKSVEAGCSFATTFERTEKNESRFRYQWNSSGILFQLQADNNDSDDNINVICSNDEGVFKRYPLEGLTTCPSLALAVADATGVSFGGVYYMSSLLLENIVPDSHWFFRRLQKDIELAENTESGADFYCLTADNKTELVELTVCKENFSLSAMTVKRSSSTVKLLWQNSLFNPDLNARIFDQYRFLGV